MKEPSYNDHVKDALAAIQTAMWEATKGELTPTKLRRVTKLAKLGQELHLEIAGGVADFEEHILRPGPAPLGGIGRPLADNVELFRNLSATLEDQEADKKRHRVRQNDAKQLEALINMKIHGMDQDKDMEEIYALVRANVLRRLQAHAEKERQAEDGASGQQGDEGGREAPLSVSHAGGVQPVG